MRIEGTGKAWAWGVCLTLMLAGTGAARGQGIVYNVPLQPVYYNLVAPETINFSIDVNGDGTIDFVLSSLVNDSAVLTAQGNNQIVVQDGFVAAMNSGETIGSSLNPVYSWAGGQTMLGVVMNLDGTPNLTESGNFAGLSSGYIGFDIVNNGLNYYGWMAVSSPIDAGLYGNVTGWAYESDPNTPIAAGAAPEPGTWALLAIGGVFLMGYRKLRC